MSAAPLANAGASLDPADLRAFARVVDLGGVTVAAKSLALPKSTVSRSLARLEEALGIVLVERSTRHLRITPAGATLRAHVTRIMRELDEAESAIAELKGHPEGVLRVDAPFAFAQFVLAPMLGGFAARNPGLRVALRVNNGRVDLLADDVDAVVRIGGSRSSSVLTRRLMTFEDWLCASPRYLDECGSPARAEALGGHRLVAPEGMVRWTVRSRHGAAAVVEGRPYLVGPEPATRRALLLEGAGVGRLPDFIAADDVAAGRLVRLLPATSLGDQSINLLCPGRSRLAKVRVFTDALVAHIRGAVVRR